MVHARQLSVDALKVHQNADHVFLAAAAFDLFAVGGVDSAEVDQPGAETVDHDRLDLVGEQAKSLNRKLGKQDQTKLEEYFDAVRTMEKKIVQQEPWLERPKPKTDVKEPNPGMEQLSS